MSKIIQRTGEFRLKLSEVASWFNVKPEYDEYDDTWHNGYDTEYVADSDIGEKLEPIKHLILSEVATSLEEAERQAIVSEMNKEARRVVIDSLMKIDVVGEYLGVDSEGNEVQVSCPSCVLDVTIEGYWGEEEVVLKIKNPEHLINDLINGHGGFYPTEIAVDAADDDNVQSRLHFLKEYFEVYGESPSRMSDRIDGSSAFSGEDFIDILQNRVSEVSEEKWAEKIAENSHDAMEDIQKLVDLKLVSNGRREALKCMVIDQVEKEASAALKRLKLGA